MKPGDWKCSSCNDVNFASRNNCRKCNNPKNGAVQNSHGQQAPNQKPGDWKCSSCNDVNFASRNNCRKCNKPKNGAVQNSYEQQAPNQKRGDWNCTLCKELNFTSRNNCRKCSAPKPNGIGSSEIVRKPGDWDCSNCNEHNFGSRDCCRMCTRPKIPQDSSSASECVVCMDKKAEGVITSCGHLGLCMECGVHLNICPICREPYSLQQFIKVFTV